MSKSFLSYAGAAVAAYFGYWNYAAAFLFNGVSAEKQRRAKNRARDAYNASLQDRMVMLDLLPEAPRTIALGRVRAVEGVRRRWVSGDNNEKLTLIVSFAGHEIDGFETFWFNDIPLTLDGSGYVVKPAQITGCSVVRSGTTATLTKTSHGRQNGEKVLIAGFSLAEFNGTFVVAGATANTFTYTIQNTGGGNPPGAAGTIDVLSPYGIDSIESHTLSGTLDGSGNASVTLTNSTINLPTAVHVSGVGDASSQGTLTVTLVSGLDYTLSGGPAGADYFVTWQHTLTTSMVRIRTYLGTDAQSVGTDLAAEYPGKLATTDDFAGIALAVIDLNYDDSVFPQGIPNITATFRGAKCLDPRTNLTEWTENPAVHAYHYARLATGWNVPSAEIRSQDFEDAADFCDTSTLFTLGVDDVTLARYRCGIVLSTDADPRQNMNAIMESMAGRWGWAGGTLRMRCGRMATAVWAMDESWIAHQVGNGGQASDSPVVRITNGVPREEKVNHVAGTCVDPDQRYQALPYPAVRDEVLIAADGAEYRLDADMPGVNHIAHAQHLASIIVREGQAPLRMEVTSNLLAYPLELFDVGTVTVDRYGMTNKTFEVIGWRWRPTEGVSLRLSEITDAIFDVVNTLNGRDPAPNGSLPSPWYVEQVVGVAVAAAATIQPDGTVFTLSTVTWTAITNQAVLVGGKVEVQYTRVDAIPAASVDWTSWIEQGGSASAAIPRLTADVYYLFRVRAINSLGVRGPWSDQVMHLVLSDVVAPEDVTNLDWEIKPGLVRITCDPCIASDYAETELRYMNTVPDYDSGDWAAATFLVSGKTNEYHHPRPPNGTYYVLAKHKDTTGNYSDGTAYITVVVDDSIDAFGSGTLRLVTDRFPYFAFADGTTHTSSSDPLVITARLYGLTGSPVFTAEAFDADSDSLGTMTLTGEGLTRILTAAQFTSLGTSGSVRTLVVSATLAGAEDELPVYRQDPTITEPRLFLDNPRHEVSTDADGAFGDYSEAFTNAAVFVGIDDVTDDFDFTITPDAGLTATINGGAGPITGAAAIVVAVSASTISDGVVEIEADDGVDTLQGFFRVVKRRASGSAYTAFFDPAEIVLPVNADGSVSSYAGARSDFNILLGTLPDTESWQPFDKVDLGVVSTLSGNRVTITEWIGLGTLGSLESNEVTPATGWQRGNSATWCEDVWVMFGHHESADWSTVLRSADFETWAEVDSGQDGRWGRAAYGGGILVAIALGVSSNAIIRSADKGLTWAADTLSQTAEWSHMHFGDGFLASADGGTEGSYSADGDTWANRTLPADDCALAFSAPWWGAVSPAGNLYTSDDAGSSWSAALNSGMGLPAGNEVHRCVGFRGALVCALRDETDQIKITIDGGATWITAITPVEYSAPIEMLIVQQVLYLVSADLTVLYTADGLVWAQAGADFGAAGAIENSIYGLGDSIEVGYLPALAIGADESFLLETHATQPGYGALSNGNRTYTFSPGASIFGSAWSRSPDARTGKRYWEFANTGVGRGQGRGVHIGLIEQAKWGTVGTSEAYLFNNYGSGSGFYGICNGNFFGMQIGLLTDGVASSNGTYSFVDGDIIGVAVDFDTGKVWLSKNNGWFAGDPVAGTGQTFTLPSGAFDPMVMMYEGPPYVLSVTLNSSAAQFAYTPPTGFAPLVVAATGDDRYAAKMPLLSGSDTVGFVRLTGHKDGELPITRSLPVRKAVPPPETFIASASPPYLQMPATLDGVVTDYTNASITARVTGRAGREATGEYSWVWTATHLTPSSGTGPTATFTAMDPDEDRGQVTFVGESPGRQQISGTLNVDKLKGSIGSGPIRGVALEAFSFGGTYIALRLMPNGQFAIKVGSGGSFEVAGQWAGALGPHNENSWLRVEASGHALDSGTTNTWLQMNANRDYVLTDAASGTHRTDLLAWFANDNTGAGAVPAYGALELRVP